MLSFITLHIDYHAINYKTLSIFYSTINGKPFIDLSQFQVYKIEFTYYFLLEGEVLFALNFDKKTNRYIVFRIIWIVHCSTVNPIKWPTVWYLTLFIFLFPIDITCGEIEKWHVSFYQICWPLLISIFWEVVKHFPGFWRLWKRCQDGMSKINKMPGISVIFV